MSARGCQAVATLVGVDFLGFFYARLARRWCVYVLACWQEAQRKREEKEARQLAKARAPKARLMKM